MHNPATYYLGVDPGFTGAFALLNRAGSTLRLWDMPVRMTGKKQFRELDLDALVGIFREIRLFPDVFVGLENPTTRPGEGAEQCFRFGRQLGIMDAFMQLHGLKVLRIPPQTWTVNLGLPGKEKDEWQKYRIDTMKLNYPAHVSLIYGMRGGLKDGRLDATLIAHYLRIRATEGIRAVAASANVAAMQAYALGGCIGKRRKHRRGDLPNV